VYTGAINLPFTFCFFGNTYNQAVVGSNGLLSFNMAYAGGTCPWEITAPGIPYNGTNSYGEQFPRNAIFGVYHDIDPSECGNARYAIVGSAPCRMFVVSFNNVCHYDCTNLRSSSMIVIYETTNVIEVYVESKPTCNSWNNGLAVLGIQNASGTVAYTAPGRNVGNWSAGFESWRFTPSGPPNYTINWYDGSTLVGTGNSVLVCPTTSTTYTAEAIYTNCDGATITVTDNVNVNVNSTGTPVTASSNAPVCLGQTVNLNATAGGTSYSWSGPGGFSSAAQNPSLGVAPVSASGTYTVTLTDANGCTSSSTINVQINDLPVATAGTSSAVCEGQPLILNGGGGSSYSWSGPNGYTDLTQYPLIDSITPADSGTYTVTVTDANGCTGSASVTLAVNPTPVATAGNNGPVCQGQPLNLTSGGGSSYSWTGPGSYSDATQNPVIAVGDTSNTGVYTVTVSTPAGCTASSTTTVTINPSPTATAGNNGPVCAGTPVTLTSGTGTGYSWSGPGAYGSSQQDPTISSPGTGSSGTYTVTVTDANGCTNTATTSLVINALPPATSGNNGPLCSGVQLDLTAGGGNSYSWSGPGSFSSAAQNPSISNANPAHSGTYTVTVTDANGCTGSSTTSVTVNNALSLTAGSNSPLCEGDALILTCNVAGNTYSWAGPAAFSSTSQNPVVSPADVAASGTYTVTMTDANGCTGTSSVNVTVNARPNAVAINTGPVCQGSSITLTGGGGGTYQWSGPGGYSSTGANPVLAPGSSSGTYTVTVTGANGCTSTASTSAVFNALPVISATASGPLCAGDDLYLSASGGTSYSWTGPSSFTDSSPAPVINNVTGDQTGWYYVNATDANGCQNSDSVAVTIYAAPVTGFEYSTGCFMTNSFQSTSTGGGDLNLQWDMDGDGVTDITLPDFSYTFADSNDQMVTLIVTDGNGCISSLTQLVDVKGGADKPHMPNVLVLSSTNGNDKFDFEVFAPGFNTCISYTFSVFNRWGTKVYSVDNDPANPDINCSSCFRGRTETGEALSPGTYFYVLEGSENIKESGMITIFN